MGWWGTRSETDERLWGDGPADILDDALEQIRREFELELGRNPTLGELRSGLNFALANFPDDTEFDQEKSFMF